jgi:hypothetical protein
MIFLSILTQISGQQLQTGRHFSFVRRIQHSLFYPPSHFTPYVQMAAPWIIPAEMGVSGAVRESVYLVIAYKHHHYRRHSHRR